MKEGRHERNERKSHRDYIYNGRMLSYERTPHIERKAGQIESRCCKLSYEADKLNSGKDIIKEKPCKTRMLPDDILNQEILPDIYIEYFRTIFNYCRLLL